MSSLGLVIAGFVITVTLFGLLEQATVVTAFLFRANHLHRTTTTHSHHVGVTPYRIPLFMAGGEGGESEWVKALREAQGTLPGEFEKEMKMKGLLGNPNSDSANGDGTNKLTVNAKLVNWLEKVGNVYLREDSSWGEAPHPLAISTDTVDEVTNESSGRGLLARRNINQEDELLKIPLRVCLTKKSAQSTFGNSVIDDGMNEYLAIACQLIHEKFVLGNKSFYKPYMDILPLISEVNPTFTWSDDDLDFLQGSPVIAATRSMQLKLKKEYEALFLGLNSFAIGTNNNDKNYLGGDFFKRFPQLFSPQYFTFDNWVWAFTMLFSRAIRLRNMRQGEILAMVPYADLINHSPFSNAYLDARETGDWLFKSGEEEVVLYADRGYRRMEQVYISYGPKSNAELLLLYGFALERNPFNSVDVTIALAAPRSSSSPSSPESALNIDGNIAAEIMDPLAEEKAVFLKSVGRSSIVDFPCYFDRYPTEMLEYLRLMMMTPEDTRGRPLDAFDYTRPISAANEVASLYSVIEAIKVQLSRYPQTEEEDAAIIKDKALFRLLSYNQRMAVRHRRNEKRLLKRTIAALEKQIRSKGLDENNSLSAFDGQSLPNEERGTRNMRLEERIAQMGLPVDWK